MSALTLAAFLLAQATSVEPGTQIRAFTLSFVDAKGAEVVDLGARDVAVVENGQTRDITSFKPDARPLAIAILVDSSAAVGEGYRLNVVDAVVGLVARCSFCPPASSRAPALPGRKATPYSGE